MKFHLAKTSERSNARAGLLETPHGTVPTPIFAPLGTQGSVKSVAPSELREVGVRMILSNTYHLYLRPGADRIAKLGGLHKFMGWDGPILTDSGGYQLFSLAPLTKVTEEGVVFRSHIDGSQHFFTPETAIEVQETLGANIIMALDHVPPSTADRERVQEAMERTHRWAERCLKAHCSSASALFGIIQGGTWPDLRKESARFMLSLGFPGYAIGGLSLGEPKDTTFAMVEEVVAELPGDVPRYLMGMGSPEDILEAVSRGIDIMDCSLPTRIARNGGLYTPSGKVNILNARFTNDPGPIQEGCDCYACAHFSSAYLRHLFKSEELLGYRLATLHNLRFFARLMGDVREAILSGTFEEFKARFLLTYKPTDEGTRLAQKEKAALSRRARQTTFDDNGPG